MDNKIKDDLAKPFAANEYEWRVQKETNAGDKVLALCYVTARAIQQRLDDVFGPFGWQVEYAPGPAGGIMCTISAWDADTKQWIRKADGAEKPTMKDDGDAIKGGYSNAIKRTGYPWGIGRLLYKLDGQWVPLQTSGQESHKVKNGPNANKYMYYNPPPLPAWAIAGGGNNGLGSKSQRPQATPPDESPPPATKPADAPPPRKNAAPKPKPVPTTAATTKPTCRKDMYIATCKKHGAWLPTKPENYYICDKLLDTDYAVAEAEKQGVDPGMFALVVFREDSLPRENDIIWTIIKAALDGKAADGSLAQLVADAQEVGAA